MRLDHDADDAPLAARELRRDVAGHVDLAPVLLAGVGVRAVDHQALGQPGARELGAGRLHARRVVVGLAPAAQDDVAVLVAARLDDRHLAALVHREKVVLLAGGEQRIDRDLHVAVGAVLEADRGRETGGELAVHLALGGAGADRAPGHEVADVLRRDHVEELAARRHPRLVDAHEEVPSDAQSLVDAEAAVEIRVVDEAFPADRRARFLEVNAHQHFELAFVLLSFDQQLLRIGERGLRIVDRAGTHDDEQPVGAPLQNFAHLAARLGDLRLHRRALDRKEADQVLRRRQRHDVLDALVVGERGLVRGDGGEIVIEGRSHVCLPKNKNRQASQALAVLVGREACGYPVQSASGRRK